jgi:DnaJ-class molecular chaperone
MNNPYKLLDISETASDQDIKKAFRKVSVTCHPDRVDNDDPEREAKTLKFTQLTEAKETLLDQQMRRAYDIGGWDMVKHLSESRRMMEQRGLKCEPIIIHKEISLNQLYNKENIKMKIPVPIYKEDGSIEETEFPMEFRADTLGKIVAQNAGIQKPDHVTGDIIVVMELEGKCPFDIKRLDLIYVAKLDLRDLLLGYEVVIPHPEQDFLVTGRYKPSDDNIMIFRGKGLSMDQPDRRGDLVVLFTPNLEWITDLDEVTTREICSILDKKLGTPRPVPEAKDITNEGQSPSQIKSRPGGTIPPEPAWPLEGDGENPFSEAALKRLGPGCPVQ